MAYVVFHDERIEGLEERGKRRTKRRGEGGNEIPSRSDEHSIVFCRFFGCFLSFVLVRVLLTDSLLFEDGGGQCADLIRFWKTMRIDERSGGRQDLLVSINAGPMTLKDSARATQSAEATFLSGIHQYKVPKRRGLYGDQNFQCDEGVLTCTMASK